MNSRTASGTDSENVHAPLADVVSRRCDNPECNERLAWAGGRGRPPLFCSANCRKRAHYAAAALMQQGAECQRSLVETDLTYRQKREIRSELARLEWVLSAYPPTATTAGDSLGPAQSAGPRHVPSAEGQDRPNGRPHQHSTGDS